MMNISFLENEIKCNVCHHFNKELSNDINSHRMINHFQHVCPNWMKTMQEALGTVFSTVFFNIDKHVLNQKFKK